MTHVLWRAVGGQGGETPLPAIDKLQHDSGVTLAYAGLVKERDYPLFWHLSRDFGGGKAPKSRASNTNFGTKNGGVTLHFVIFFATFFEPNFFCKKPKFD